MALEFAVDGWRAAVRWTVLAVAVGLAACLGGCTPSLDWRRMQPEGWGLALMLPCRPDVQVRSVSLAGVPVMLTLLACMAEGHTFAVASADVDDPLRVGAVLQALAEAAKANVRGTLEAEEAATVSGMTPHPSARQWRLHGQLPDGQAVRERGLVFSHGSRVFQVTLLGARVDEPLARPFFEAIEIAR